MNEIFGTLALERTEDRTKSFWAIIPADARDEAPIRLQSGDVLTIFNTIASGDKAWAGQIDLEYNRMKQTGPTGYTQQAVRGLWVHGLQRNVDPDTWMEMFENSMPAKLEKSGKAIYGALNPFFETGTEGVIWAIHQYGKKGYDGLHIIEAGDKLTVYNMVLGGIVAFEETLSFKPAVFSFNYNAAYAEKVETTPDFFNLPAFCDSFIENRPAILKRPHATHP
ncbi:MAG: hypothetical protein KGQ41_01120 [Alphaproteobacteria bacterium]|nr:hypothetical protein [Alphaproteobacteria bacterium]